MIRDFSINDVDSINNIGSQISANFVEKYSVINNINKEFSKIFIYEDEIIKGFILVEDHYDFVDIIAIAVDNNYQHQGIGYNLIDYVTKKYNNRILLEVKCTNENAIKLYEKSGFKIINIRKKYYDGIDAYIMERSI